jgi:lysophospholipase L1-like esterase
MISDNHRILPGNRFTKYRFWIRAMLVFLSAAFGLFLAEWMLAIVGISYPLPYETDEFCGSKLLPNFRGYWSQEGQAYVSVNRFGFRGPEWSIPKPANTLRIAVLGDSYIEALQVPESERFSSVLEKQLNQLATHDNHVEVMSFGISGWGTTNQLQALRHYVWQFEPDIVLLAFLSANDVRNNDRILEPEKCRPFFESLNGELVVDLSFRNHPLYEKSDTKWSRTKQRVINSSRILQVIQAIRRVPPSTNSPTQSRSSNVEIGLDDGGFIAPRTEDWQRAWTTTEAIVAHMYRDVSKKQRDFVVLCIPAGQQVHPDLRVRSAFAEHLGTDDLTYSERRIHKLGEAEGFQVVGLAEPLGEFAETTQSHLHGFPNTELGTGHWNATGHRQAARIVAEAILPTVERRVNK